jgi:hypothetical protein
MPICEKVFESQYHLLILLCATCYAQLPIPRPEPSHRYLLDRPPNCLGFDPAIPGLTCRRPFAPEVLFLTPTSVFHRPTSTSRLHTVLYTRSRTSTGLYRIVGKTETIQSQQSLSCRRLDNMPSSTVKWIRRFDGRVVMARVHAFTSDSELA